MYSVNQKKYIDSVNGEAHQSALDIIASMETSWATKLDDMQHLVKMEIQIDNLKAQIEQMSAVLHEKGLVFAHYARLHIAECTEDGDRKAKIVGKHAEDCLNAIPDEKSNVAMDNFDKGFVAGWNNRHCAFVDEDSNAEDALSEFKSCWPDAL
jgi:hypothetical protein